MADKTSVADEAWIATALLHREHPDRKDFKTTEIVRRAEQIAGPEAGDTPPDPILALRGLGRTLWADEDADAYVSRLREGWS